MVLQSVQLWTVPIYMKNIRNNNYRLLVLLFSQGFKKMSRERFYGSVWVLFLFCLSSIYNVMTFPLSA